MVFNDRPIIAKLDKFVIETKAINTTLYLGVDFHNRSLDNLFSLIISKVSKNS